MLGWQKEIDFVIPTNYEGLRPQSNLAMPNNRPARGRLFLAIPAIAILTISLLYLWGYCVTGSRTPGPTEVQTYQHEWQGRLFTPAAKVESVIRQKPITVEWRFENPFP